MDLQIDQLRHSAAHLLAHAVSELYPDTIFTIGPATDSGFFYDFLPTTNFTEEMLAAIEERMHDIATRNLPITQELMTKEAALTLFKHNPFKTELISQIPDTMVGISRQGDFFDLCKGGHVARTGVIQNFKLTNLSGAYWRGDANNQQLQRITGVVFATAAELAAFEKQREEALLYDHRRLGKEMDLFSLHPEGPGFPFFHPKGVIIINQMLAFMRNLLADDGYQEISTPIMLNEKLWVQSGHASFYRENMYFCPIENNSFAIKPMNCPGAFLVYNLRPRSYRELPLKLSEFGKVHRHELSGVLHGLLRVRAFTQDDAHIMCTMDQVEDQITNVLRLIFITMKTMGFENLYIALATRPKDAMGSVELWDKAITSLSAALTKSGHAFTLKDGEGAFYGPKIEIGIHDSMGRTWQCGTIQVDFMQPENFDMTYVSSQGTYERVVVLHHAIYGSLERFFAILLEHHKGKLPFWLSPVQCRILPISEHEHAYAATVAETLKEAGIRVEIDRSADPLSGKIKQAQLDRVCWMLVVGKKEVEQNTVTIRMLSGEQKQAVPLADAVAMAQQANKQVRA